MQNKLYTLTIFLFCLVIKVSSQISFLGFDQEQCNLLKDSPYSYESFFTGKWTTPAYRILRSGDVIFTKSGVISSGMVEISHSPYWIEDLKFISNSVGFIVETSLGEGSVLKTSDFGKTWNKVSSGNIGLSSWNENDKHGYLSLYTINAYTSLLIASRDTMLFVTRGSEFGQHTQKIKLSGHNEISINDTIYGNPDCIEDSLTCKIKFNNDTIRLKISLVKLELPTSNINSVTTKNLLDIYPNPCVDFLKFNYNSEIKFPISFEIYDIQGNKVIVNELLDPFDDSISVKSLSEGIYFIRLRIANKYMQNRFIKINNR